MASFRIDRINEEVMREMAEIIRELKDPRIPAMTSIIKVDITRDLKYGKIYLSVMGDEKQQKDALAAFKSAAGFIRREIGNRVNLRNTPEFAFVLDNSIEYGTHISELLKNIETDGEAHE